MSAFRLARFAYIVSPQFAGRQNFFFPGRASAEVDVAVFLVPKLSNRITFGLVEAVNRVFLGGRSAAPARAGTGRRTFERPKSGEVPLSLVPKKRQVVRRRGRLRF